MDVARRPMAEASFQYENGRIALAIAADYSA